MDSSKEPARKKVKLNPIHDKPGNPSHPKTFIKCETNEQSVAAYAGYNNIADLRAFATSWPMLRAVMDFEPFGADMQPYAALSLVRDHSESFRNIENPAGKWSHEDGDSTAMKANKKASRLATILIQLVVDVGVMEINSMADNEMQQGIYSKLWESKSIRTKYRLSKISRARYPPVSLEEERDASKQHAGNSIVAPRLGPHTGESVLERYNRCWMLMKYFRRTAHVQLCESRFSEKGVARGSEVESHNIPGWMRPVPTAFPHEMESSAIAQGTDALPYDYFEISWLHELDEEEAVKDAINDAESRGIRKPSQRQPLRIDPRLFEGPELGNQIRKQFRCADFKTDILHLYLSYLTIDDKDSDGDCNDDPLPKTRVERTVVVNTDKWPDILEIFAARDNSIFVFQVGFCATT